MPSEYSPLLRLELIGPGEQSGLWGDTTNKNLGTLLEQAVAGVAVIPLVSAGIYEVQALDGTKDEARSSVLQFTGTPGGAVTIKIPSTTKLYVVRNSTNQTITVRTAAQISNPLLGGVELLTNEATLVFCDGTYAIVGIQTTNTSPILTVTKGGTGKGSFSTAGFVKTPGGTGDFTSSATVSATTEISGVLPIGSGGTGTILSPGAGQLLIGTSSGAYVPAALSAGTGISINNTSGGIQISASGSAAGVNSIAGSNINVSPASGNVVISLTNSNVVNALGYTPATTTSPTFSSSVTSPTYYVGTGSNYITQSVSDQVFIYAGGVVGAKFTSSGIGTSNLIATGSIGCGNLFYGNFNLTVKGTNYSQSAAYIESYSGGSSGLGINMVGGSVYALVFQYNSTSSGQIVVTPGATSYETTSDRRLKDNIVPLENSGAEIDALKPRQFTWKTTGETKKGFIADELQQIIPGAVSGEPDAVDEEGKPIYQGVDASTPEMIALIICELQSLRKRVTAAETKIDAQAAEITALKGAK